MTDPGKPPIPNLSPENLIRLKPAGTAIDVRFFNAR
jgi:hypothetical protein